MSVREPSRSRAGPLVSEGSLPDLFWVWHRMAGRFLWPGFVWGQIPALSALACGCARVTQRKDILLPTFPVSVSLPASLWLMVSPPPTCVVALQQEMQERFSCSFVTKNNNNKSLLGWGSLAGTHVSGVCKQPASWRTSWNYQGSWGYRILSWR